MENSGKDHLPPLAELIPQIDFEIYGLKKPYLGLQLKSLYYGVDENEDRFVGLTLCYYSSSEESIRVLSVESAELPAVVAGGGPDARLAWSHSDLFQLRETTLRLYHSEPLGWVDEGVAEQQFQAGMEAVKALQWATLAPESMEPPLAGMQFARDPEGVVVGRLFKGDHMLLVAAMGLHPKSIFEAIKLLTPLQGVPDVVHRHQAEFESLTLGS
jgi:hypothetical protein